MDADLVTLVPPLWGCEEFLGVAYPGLRRLTATWPGLAQVGPSGLPPIRNKNGLPKTRVSEGHPPRDLLPRISLAYASGYHPRHRSPWKPDA
jgi:hypothetical protein